MEIFILRRSGDALKQTAQGGGGVTYPGGVQEKGRCGTEIIWSVDMVGVG